MALKIKLLTAALSGSLGKLYPDANMTSGSLVILDFSNPSSYNSGSYQNVANTNALALVGDNCHPNVSSTVPAFGGNAVILSAANVGQSSWSGLYFPTKLTDYFVGKNIACSIFMDARTNDNYFDASYAIMSMMTNYSDFTDGYAFVRVQDANNFSLPFSAPYQGTYVGTAGSGTPPNLINQIGFSNAGCAINGTKSSGSTRRLTTTEVPSSPTTKFIRITPEFQRNTCKAKLYRVHMEDLAVSGRTFNAFYDAEKAYFAKYHPNKSLLCY